MIKSVVSSAKGSLLKLKYRIRNHQLQQRQLAITNFLDDKQYQQELVRMPINKAKIGRAYKPGLPNVLCVGVQKSATSFLYSILRSHPSVSAFPKDILALDRLHETGSLNEFDKLSNKIDPSKNVILHFDVGYIFNGRSGISTIKTKLCANPKIIICLRDPVERMLSEYRMRVRSLNSKKDNFIETEDFEHALKLSDARSNNDFNYYRNNFAYIENSLYADRIKAYLDEFGQTNVFVIVMESDLARNTRITLAKLFNFLSIFDEHAFKQSLITHNEFQQISRSPSNIDIRIKHSRFSKSIYISSQTNLPNKSISNIKINSDIPSQLQVNLNNPSKNFLESALKLESRLTYTPCQETRRNLYELYFKEDIARLEKLLNNDLRVWRETY